MTDKITLKALVQADEGSAPSLNEVRRANLKAFFAGNLPEAEKSYLSQVIGGQAPFGEKAARRVEAEYGIPAGSLDRVESPAE